MKRREVLGILGIAPVGLCLSYQNNKTNKIYGKNKCLIEAHRGNSANAPENTLVSVEQAVRLGVDRVEIDLRYTKDEQLVIIHDNTVNRTTNKTGMVSELTYQEISMMDAGSWKSDSYRGEKVPLLGEIFEICKGKSMVNIDLKDAAAIPKMVKVIKDLNMENEVVITGLIPACTKQIRELGIHLTMFYESGAAFGKLLSDGKTAEAIILAIDEARFYQLPGFLFNSNWITAEIVHLAHLHGLAVNVWDVNSEERAHKMFEAGVDAIMTDNPALFTNTN